MISLSISKYDSSNIKILNKKIILRLIHRRNPISRNDIARLTGLKASSVTRLVNEMISEGHILEAGVIESESPGRKKISLRINPEYRISLLFDVGVTYSTVALGYYDGSVRVVESFRTPKSYVDFFKLVQNYFNNLSLRYNHSLVLLSIPGMVDTDNGIIINAPNLGWRDVRIKNYLDLEVPIIADNEANLSVLAEKYYSKALINMSNLVFILVREGVGTGLMIDGKLYRGKFFSAGEFGHMTVDISSDELCHCGKTGCWELYSSIRYALRRARRELNFHEEDFNKLKTMPEAKFILLDMASNIAEGIVNIINAVNPEAVILGGEISDMPAYFYQRLISIVRKKALKPASTKVVVIPSIFKNVSSNLIGASICAIEYIIDNI